MPQLHVQQGSRLFAAYCPILGDVYKRQVRVCFEKSFCLSADVTAAYDPNFSDVYELSLIHI